MPVAVYGGVLLMSAVAYYFLTLALLSHHGPQSTLAKAVGSKHKEKISLIAYALALATALAVPWLAVALYWGVAVLWVVPDKRIEARLK